MKKNRITLDVKNIKPFINQGQFDLILPEIIIESFDEDLTKTFKTSFDQIWNACGYPRSFQYNEKGDFKAK